MGRAVVRSPSVTRGVLVGLVVLVVACQPTGDPIRISTHCGLDFPVIAYQGRHWKFEDVGEQPNPPPGWDNPFDTIYIQRVEGNHAVVIGGDGKEWSLVETNLPPPDGCL